MAILIKNGTLITASDSFEADILIEGEKISLIGSSLHHPSAEVIDATGRLIMPGGIDPHVHLDLPMFGTVSSDDHYTGHKAAAFGGTTTVMDLSCSSKFIVGPPECFVSGGLVPGEDCRCRSLPGTRLPDYQTPFLSYGNAFVQIHILNRM